MGRWPVVTVHSLYRPAAKADADPAAALSTVLVRQLLKDSHAFAGKDAGGGQAQDAFIDVVAEAVAHSIDLHVGKPANRTGAAASTSTELQPFPRLPARHAAHAHEAHAHDEDAGDVGVNDVNVDDVDDVADVVAGRGRVSSGFGVRTDPFTHKHAFHHGVDVAAPKGSPIHALSAGRVTIAGPVKGYGNLVEVTTDDGHRVRYAHAERALVKVGDVVNVGDTVATVGSTGRSTGPHVHVEVRDGEGAAVDPETALFVSRGLSRSGR